MQRILVRIFLVSSLCYSAHTWASVSEDIIKTTLASLTGQGTEPQKVQPIIDHLLQHPNDQQALVQLLQAITTQELYLDRFFYKTNWEQWEQFTAWLVQADIPLSQGQGVPYVAEIIRRQNAFARYAALEALVQKIIVALKDDAAFLQEMQRQENISLLDSLYSCASAQQQALLEALVIQHMPQFNLKASITKLLLLQQYIPHFVAKTTANHFANIKNTQSKPHFFSNLAHTLIILNRSPEAVRKALLAAYKKEQEERARGNYVFYHAQQWHLHFSADIYKQLWNLVHNDAVGDDFTFLRYDQQTTAPDQYYDHLFMNHALFGNARNDISCSATYFTYNHSVRPRHFSSADLCAKLRVQQLYRAYQTEFKRLETLHQAASTYGNLLLVSVPAQQLSFVKPVFDGGPARTVTINQPNGSVETDDTKLILDTLINNPGMIPDSDDIEYTMPLTTAYALNPQSGPRMYTYNAADPLKLKAYEQARDQLFAKIKQAIRTRKIKL